MEVDEEEQNAAPAATQIYFGIRQSASETRASMTLNVGRAVPFHTAAARSRAQVEDRRSDDHRERDQLFEDISQARRLRRAWLLPRWLP